MLASEVRKMTINNVIGNFAGHAGITYWIKRDLPGIQAGGAEGYIADFLVTGFLFCGILAAIFIFMYRKKAAAGEFTPEEVKLSRVHDWLPVKPWPASVAIGLAGLVSAALPLCAYLLVVGQSPLSPAAVSLTKGVWAALVAALIVPVSIYHGAAAGLAKHQMLRH